MRKHGHTTKADELDVRINELIRDIRSRRLAGMTDASNRELWNAVKANSNSKKEIRFYRNIYLQMLML